MNCCIIIRIDPATLIAYYTTEWLIFIGAAGRHTDISRFYGCDWRLLCCACNICYKTCLSSALRFRQSRCSENSCYHSRMVALYRFSLAFAGRKCFAWCSCISVFLINAWDRKIDAATISLLSNFVSWAYYQILCKVLVNRQ